MRVDLLLEQPFKWLLRLLIRTYQLTLSPILPACCRFEPSCSNYALQALGKKRLPVALWLIVKRLARCHPFCRGGYDPVE